MEHKKFVVKDSGERQEFETGAIRDMQAGKGRYDLIPPIMLKRLATHYEEGGRKYGDNNFRVGIPIKRYLDSAIRHIEKYRMGIDDEDHIIAAIWNLSAIIETEHLVDLGFLDKNLLDGNYYSKENFEIIKQQVIQRNKKIIKEKQDENNI